MVGKKERQHAEAFSFMLCSGNVGSCNASLVRDMALGSVHIVMKITMGNVSDGGERKPHTSVNWLDGSAQSEHNTPTVFNTPTVQALWARASV